MNELRSGHTSYSVPMDLLIPTIHNSIYYFYYYTIIIIYQYRIHYNTYYYYVYYLQSIFKTQKISLQQNISNS